MSTPQQATETQIKNIQLKTGKSLTELQQLVLSSGLTKHGEIRDMLKRELGLGHGDANALTHAVLQSDGTRAAEAKGATTTDVIAEIYAGPKAGLRPIHDKLMAAIAAFGAFEMLPKKGYVSLRRKKQFAMIGPATKSQVEVGLNVKELPAATRLTVVPAGGMCNYKIRVDNPEQVDAELLGWIEQAYASAG